jgi:hypothetical protein
MDWHGASPRGAISSDVKASLDTEDARLGAEAELKILMVSKMILNNFESQQASLMRELAQRIQGVHLNHLVDFELRYRILYRRPSVLRGIGAADEGSDHR